MRTFKYELHRIRTIFKNQSFFFSSSCNFEGLEFEKIIIPLGPSVTETVSASLLMPRSKLNLQSSPKHIFFPVDFATKLLLKRDWDLTLDHFDFPLFAKKQKQTNDEILHRERERRGGGGGGFSVTYKQKGMRTEQIDCHWRVRTEKRKEERVLLGVLCCKREVVLPLQFLGVETMDGK